MQFLVQIAVMIVSSLIAAALAPKPKGPKAAGLEDWEFPTADDGTPEAVFFGDCWTPSWMVLAIGNYRTRPVRESSTIGGSVRIGYRYYFGLHMGIGRGPLDELVEIEVGGRTAWQGSVTESQQIYIDKRELFGGDKKEGGIQGPLDVMMGEPDQPVNAELEAMVGGLVPAYRGVCTLFFDGLISSMSQYPKPWTMRVRRGLKGWDGPVWYQGKCIIELAGGQIKAMNAAHILVESNTNRHWGRGLPLERLDLASYQAVADQLYDEGFGLCLKWSRQDSLKTFIQVVLNHIGATQYVSRRTGLLTLDLIRGGYDAETLPLFDYSSGLLSIEEEVIAAGGTVTNEIVATYRDPITNEDRTARAQNLGAIQAAGAVFSDSVDYSGLPTYELAIRVAQRDLRANMRIRRYKLRFDRRGYKINPGGLFRISAPERGIESLVLRAGRIEDGPITDGAITVTALEDVYGLPDAVYSAEQPSTWQPPNLIPQPALDQGLFELSYWDLVHRLSQTERDALADNVGFVGSLGVRPSGVALDYLLATRVGAAAYEQRGEGDWVPTGVLDAVLEPGDTATVLTGGIELDEVEIGTAGMIGGEIVRVDSLNPATGDITIARGCVDTVPAQHPAGTRMWFYQNHLTVDTTEYLQAEEVFGKLLTRTGGGILDEALAAASSAVVSQRQVRPYPSANVQINGSSWPDSIVGDIAIAWVHRDRLLQQGTMVDWYDPTDVGPEPGTTYTVEIYDADTSTLLHAEAGLTGKSFSYPEQNEFSEYGAVSTTVRVVVYSTRDGHDSLVAFDHSFGRISTIVVDPQPFVELGTGIFDGTGGIEVTE